MNSNVRSDGVPNGSTWRSNMRQPLVSVPVLSLHKTSVLPKFCIVARFLTMTFLRAICTAPCARVTEVIIGRNSGVNPTASAIANRRDSNGSLFSAALMRKTNSTRNNTVFMMKKPNWRVPRSNSVSGGRIERRFAIPPNTVAGPVAVTKAVAVPLTIEVPRKILLLSPAERPFRDASFSTGRDSPVKADS